MGSAVAALRPSCCSVFWGFFASVDFLLSGNGCTEIWLASRLRLHRRTSSQVDRTLHSLATFPAITSPCLPAASPLAVSQSVFVCCFWQISVQCNHLSPTSLGLPLLFFLSRSLLSFSAKATQRRSLFFSLLPLKSWKPCEVVRLSVYGRARRCVGASCCEERKDFI